jgi:hypothetical protein
MYYRTYMLASTCSPCYIFQKASVVCPTAHVPIPKLILWMLGAQFKVLLLFILFDYMIVSPPGSATIDTQSQCHDITMTTQELAVIMEGN